MSSSDGVIYVEICDQEAKSRIHALKDKGEAFRFSDFLEEKEPAGFSLYPGTFHLCGLKSWCLVPLAIFLFSVVFALSLWLILCHPGPEVEQLSY
jgi:hypothetical protein